jgi:GcrA cell cycle regulator
MSCRLTTLCPNRCSALRKRQSTNAKSGHATASHQPAGAGARVAMEPAKPRCGNGQPAWSAEFTNTLKALWATWTAGELCKLMGITRNAIIGKANRLGLPRKKPSGNGKAKPQRIGPRIRPPVFYVATQPAPVIELDFLGLTVDEVQSHECHYPHGGEGTAITFCGQLVEHGSSYCPYHRKLCVHPATTRRDSYNDFMSFRGVR